MDSEIEKITTSLRVLENAVRLNNSLKIRRAYDEVEKLIKPLLSDPVDSNEPFVETWIKKHEDLLIGLQINVNIRFFISIFEINKSFSFDAMVAKLKVIIDKNEVFRVIGLALSRGLIRYDDGVFSLID